MAQPFEGAEIMTDEVETADVKVEMDEEELKARIREDAVSVYNEGARKNQLRFSKLIQLGYSSTKAAALMLVAAIVALVIANTGLYEPFLEIIETEVGFIFGETHAAMSIAEVINDIFMAIFFLLFSFFILPHHSGLSPAPYFLLFFYHARLSHASNLRNPLLSET